MESGADQSAMAGGQRRPGTRPPWFTWLVSLAILLSVILIATHLAEERQFAQMLQRARPAWLIVALVLQSGTYVCQALVWRLALDKAGTKVPLSRLVRFSVAQLFVNQAIPSAAISGSIFIAKALAGQRVRKSTISAAILLGVLTYYAGYVLALLAGLAIYRSVGRLSTPVTHVATASLLLAATICGLLFMVARRGLPRSVPFIRRIGSVRALLELLAGSETRRVITGPVVLAAIGLQISIFMLDAATLWAILIGLSAGIPPAHVFAAFIVASLARTVGILPGGLGTFEAAAIGTLALFGMPVAGALTGVLIFRGFSFWLPMLPGMALARKETRSMPAADGRIVSDHATRARLPVTELFHELGSRPGGLSGREAARRMTQFGPNEFAKTRLLATARDIFRAAVNPLILILMAAGIASAFLGEVADALIIGSIVLMSAGLNAWQSIRSERAVRHLQASVAPTATVLRDGSWREVKRREIVVGDLVHLAAGDLVPADGRLVEAKDLYVQQAALTGESLPAEKSAAATALETNGPDCPHLVFLGTSIVGGTAEAVIYATGAETAFGDIVDRLAARPEETEFERGSRRFGMMILETVVFLVLFILIVNIGVGRDPIQSILFSVALAVGLTPEFLPMITTVTLSQGAVQMAKARVIVKHLPAIQNLGSIDILCCDKTGTLTEGTMSLDSALDPEQKPDRRPLMLGYLNSRFESGIKSPLDAAILAVPGLETDGYEKADEIPFDFDRRCISVVLRRGSGGLLITKGAPEGVLKACSSYEIAGRTLPLDPPALARCQETYRSISAQGLRTIAVAYRETTKLVGLRTEDERDLTLAGFLTFADHLIPGVATTIESLRRDGIKIKILTGDNQLVAERMCRQAGIDCGRIALSSDIEAMDEAGLARLANRTDVFARVTPAQKHRIIRALKADGHVVGFLGDGINDAPSLHEADVGISAAGAVDVAREASDIILLEKRLDVLHAGIVAGRKSFGNVLKYLLMSTSSNFGNMFSMAGAALFLPFLPMLPIQILLNNFLYDVAQVTIPRDNVDQVYIRRPQRWDIGSIRRFMLVIGPVSSLYDVLTFLVLLKFFRFDEAHFHTGWFVESLATQTLVLFVIRTAGRPWSNRPTRPLIITTLFVVGLGLSLPYTPLARHLGFEKLPAAYYAFLVIAVGSYLVIVEIIKGRVMRQVVAAWR